MKATFYESDLVKKIFQVHRFNIVNNECKNMHLNILRYLSYFDHTVLIRRFLWYLFKKSQPFTVAFSHSDAHSVYVLLSHWAAGSLAWNGTVASVFYYKFEDFKRISACFHLLPQSNKTVISRPYSCVKDRCTLATQPSGILFWLIWFITWTSFQIKREVKSDPSMDLTVRCPALLRVFVHSKVRESKL